MPLTANEVKNAKPGRHSDGRGLYLLVKPKADDSTKAGAKSWVLRVQYKGTRHDYGLGAAVEKYPDSDSQIPLIQRKSLVLKDAREKAAIGRDLAKAGIVPSDVWGREDEEVPTFEQAARKYHSLVESGWKNGKHGAQWLTTLEAYAFPKIGAKLVKEIDADAIHKVLLPIWLKLPETARRVRQRVGKVLDFSHSKGWRDTEAPMRAVNSLMQSIKQPKGGNFEALPWRDLPGFVSGLQAQAPSVGRYALLFTILTCARSNETRFAEWEEIDWDACEWRLPPSKMKGNKLHIVPLVPAAMDILRELRGLLAEQAGLIFPGAKKGKPLSENTLAKALRVAGGGSATVHGFRSTFRDWAADNGFTDAWAESALAHGNPDKTISAYKRTTFFEQRREKLMPAWARYVLGDQSNVVSLVEARA
jgi:integrase